MSNTGELNYVKTVSPKGDILNDRGTDVDHLGHVIYAKALARQIERIKTPVTVGMFAPWGSGKSFLLKHIQSLVSNKQEQDDLNATEKKDKGEKKQKRGVKALTLFTPLFALFVLILSMAMSIVFDVTTKLPAWFTIFLILSFVLLILLLAIIVSIAAKAYSELSWFKYKWVLFSAMYTKLPISKEEIPTVQTTAKEKIVLRQKQTNNISKSQEINGNLDEHVQSESHDKQSISSQNESSKMKETPRRFIFVNFNAWECAGCDKLWAGIVTTLATKIEEEFGVFTTRVFRSLSLDTTSKDILLNESCELLVKIKTCPKDKLRNLMTDYGKVLYCECYCEYMAGRQKSTTDNQLQDNKDGFVIRYSTPRGARNALKALRRFGIDADYLTKLKRCPEAGFSMWNHLKKHPTRSCHVPDYLWSCLWVLVCILLPIAALSTIQVTNIYAEESDEDEVSKIVGQMLSCLPCAFGVSYMLFKVVWAYCHSQKERIIKTLKNVKAHLENELGFMNEVKEEVQAITNLIHTVEFVKNVEYKVIIMIDDLDRVPLPKVKAVLEAVNILLSDRFSPFICLIAVDSRVAVKSFEIETENDEAKKETPIINGFEYLKKIINLPFCLPEIDCESKTTFIAGLIDESDETEASLVRLYNPTTDGEQPASSQENEQNRSSDENTLEAGSDKADCPEQPFRARRALRRRENSANKQNVKCPSVLHQKEFKDFLFSCREYMHGNAVLKHHIHGNPRNIKRIFNVISITASVIQCVQERKKHHKEWNEFVKEYRSLPNIATAYAEKSTANEAKPSTACCSAITSSKQGIQIEAKDVVLWVVLTDQWPCRISYIIQAIEDSDQRKDAGRTEEAISDKDTLFKVYEQTNAEKIKRTSESFEYLMKLDSDPDLLYSLLKKHQHLTKGKVKELLKYSINLDRNLRRAISFETDKTDLPENKRAKRQQNDQTNVYPESRNLTATDSKPPKSIREKSSSPNPQIEDSSTQNKCSHIPAGELLNDFEPNKAEN